MSERHDKSAYIGGIAMSRVATLFLVALLTTGCTAPFKVSEEFLNGVSDAEAERAAAQQEVKSVLQSPNLDALKRVKGITSQTPDEYYKNAVAAAAGAAPAPPKPGDDLEKYKQALKNHEERVAAAQPQAASLRKLAEELPRSNLPALASQTQQHLDDVGINYEAARGAWDGLIDTVIFLIQTNHNTSDWAGLQSAFATAKTASQTLRSSVEVAMKDLASVQQALAPYEGLYAALIVKPKGLSLTAEDEKFNNAVVNSANTYVPVIGPILDAVLSAQLKQNEDDRKRAIDLLTQLKWPPLSCVDGSNPATCVSTPTTRAPTSTPTPGGTSRSNP
jgi:hypothetical protein